MKNLFLVDVLFPYTQQPEEQGQLAVRHRHPGGGHHARTGASDARVHQPAEGEEVPFHRRPQQGAFSPVPHRHQVRPSSSASFFVLFSHNFLVARRQIDRLYDWKKSPDTDVVATLKKQKKNTKDEFDERAKAVIVEFAQQVLI